MAIFSNIQNPLPFTFGILGNIISIMVYLAPAPTFYRIVKKKSTEGFQSVPYVVALFSAMIWIYYATLKSDATLLISINSVGCVIETIYIAIYLAYAPKKVMVLTLKFLALLNFVGFCLIVGLTHYLLKRSNRARALGWICIVLSVSVFVAPLSIMKKVVRTKSVEFMPFWLSFFLAVSAVMWFFYGLLMKDFFVALPNVLGFFFGIIQMVLYVIYKNATPTETKLPITTCITKPTPTVVITTEVHPISSLPKCNEENSETDINQIVHCIQADQLIQVYRDEQGNQQRNIKSINLEEINLESILQTGHCEKSMDTITSSNQAIEISV